MKSLVLTAVAKAVLGLSFAAAVALVAALATNWAPVVFFILVASALVTLCWVTGDLLLALFMDWRRTRKGWSSSHWK